MISLHIEGGCATDILAELKALAAGFSRETDDRLIERMHEHGLGKPTPIQGWPVTFTTTPPAAAVEVAAIAGTDDGAQIELPLGETKRKRRTKAEIAADEAAARAEQAAIIAARPKDIVVETIVQTTQPEVVNNTGSAQPLQVPPAADGAGAGEIVDAGRGTPSPVAEISPEAFRAKLQEAFTTDDGLRHLGSLLQEFGYERVKNVEAKDYGAIMARADQLVADRVAA